MKVLVVGSGGREHAICWKLSQSSLVDKIYCAPGNAGIEEITECLPIKTTDIEKIIKFAKNVDIVVVGPENPLADGIINELPKNKGFGPTKEAATIEADKAFAKKLMKKVSIPTAEFDIFNNIEKALSFVENIKYPIVIKAAGLAYGKGTFIIKNENEAKEVLNDIMVEKKFGSAGDKIIIEQYLEGEEVSVIVFTDGKDFVPLLPCQDYKRLFDGDKGPNTGGMGSYAPAILNEKELGNIIEKIFAPCVWGLKQEGIIYKGILYGGLIITNEGPKVLEFNCRFGDPETQPVMPLLKTDLMELILATIEENLKSASIKWEDKYGVCVVIASKGYPEKYETGKQISGLNLVKDAIVFHAGTKKEKDKFYTAGGRVIGITATDKSLKETVEKVYNEVNKIYFDNMYYRKDIAKRALEVSSEK